MQAPLPESCTPTSQRANAATRQELGYIRFTFCITALHVHVSRSNPGNSRQISRSKCRVFRPKPTQNRRKEAKIPRILLAMAKPSQIGGQTDDSEENQVNRPFSVQILGSARSKIASDFRFFSRPLAIHA